MEIPVFLLRSANSKGIMANAVIQFDETFV